MTPARHRLGSGARWVVLACSSIKVSLGRNLARLPSLIARCRTGRPIPSRWRPEGPTLLTVSMVPVPPGRHHRAPSRVTCEGPWHGAVPRRTAPCPRGQDGPRWRAQGGGSRPRHRGFGRGARPHLPPVGRGSSRQARAVSGQGSRGVVRSGQNGCSKRGRTSSCRTRIPRTDAATWDRPHDEHR